MIRYVWAICHSLGRLYTSMHGRAPAGGGVARKESRATRPRESPAHCIAICAIDLSVPIGLTNFIGRDTVAVLDTPGEQKWPAEGQVPIVRVQGGTHRPLPAQAGEPEHRAGLSGPEELPCVLGQTA